MPDTPATVTIPDVELVTLGTWRASTGDTTIGPDDLASMLAASTDPEVDQAAMRIGHIDPRFDGEPALGWVRNLRQLGNKLIGDLVDVPSKLAEIIPRALKRRSVEIAWGYKTPSGKTYKAALTGLALLGVTPPAVKGLADVLARYSQSPSVDGAVAVLQGLEQVDSVSWIDCRGPAHLASDNDPHAPSDPREGVVKDEEIRALFGLAADAPITDQMRTIAAERAKADPPKPDPTGDAPKPDPATGDAPKPDPTDPPKPDPTGDAPKPELVTLSADQLATLIAQAGEGAKAMKTLREQERDKLLTAAMSAGKFAPASLKQWQDWYDEKPEMVSAQLAALPNLFPTTEIGHAHLSAGADPDDAAWDAWFKDTLGIEHQKGA